MLLKFVCEGKLKKVSLDNRTVTLSETLEIASRLAKTSVDQIELYYKYSESDVKKIVDMNDFEQFFTNSNQGSEVHPTIEVKIATQNSEISPVASECLKEMEQRVKSLSETLVEVKNFLVISKEIEVQIQTQPEKKHEIVPEVVPETQKENEQNAPEVQPLAEKISPETKENKLLFRNYHMNTGCDGCHAQLIIGRRFKCMICPNYNLCESCDSKEEHEHPMLRLPKLSSNFFLDKVQKNFVSLEEERVKWFNKKMCRKTTKQTKKETSVGNSKDELRGKRKRDQFRKDRKLERKEMKSDLIEVQACHKHKFCSYDKEQMKRKEKYDRDVRKMLQKFQKYGPQLDQLFESLNLLNLKLSLGMKTEPTVTTTAE